MRGFLTIFSFLLLGSVAWAQTQSTQVERLHAAASRGDPKTLNETLRAGVEIDARDARGQTALLLAVEAGHTAIARALMERGASVNVQAANQDTPWLLAGASGRTEILELMLERGPDLSIRNRFGGNALIPACERGHVATVRLLASRTKIDVNHVNNPGWTCLLEIVILGDGGAPHREVTQLVLAAGANPNLADKYGVSPLAHALRRGQIEVGRMIAAAGGR